MARIKGSVASQKRRRKYTKAAKGQFGHRKSRYIQARRSVEKGLAYAFRDRKVKKREFRSLWIARISAACKDAGMTYSRFIKGLSEAKVGINRKMISELAIDSPAAFHQLVKLASSGQVGKAKAKPEAAPKASKSASAKK